MWFKLQWIPTKKRNNSLAPTPPFCVTWFTDSHFCNGSFQKQSDSSNCYESTLAGTGARIGKNHQVIQYSAPRKKIKATKVFSIESSWLVNDGIHLFHGLWTNSHITGGFFHCSLDLFFLPPRTLGWSRLQQPSELEGHVTFTYPRKKVTNTELPGRCFCDTRFLGVFWKAFP